MRLGLGWLQKRLLRVADRRSPDVVIGETTIYLRRWWLIRRNRFFNAYLHEFCRSDDDRALHDHPWAFNVSWLLKGQYVEVTEAGHQGLREGAVKVRWGHAPHRVLLLGNTPVWTLFLTGPKVREWGFHCPTGWRHWRDFTRPGFGSESGGIGRGCE